MALLRRVVQAISALLVLCLVAAGLPVALVRWGRWPITGIPSWGQVRELPSTVLTDSSLFGILTLAAWFVWAAFVGSVLLELVASMSGRPGVDLPMCGPLQRMARPLVASLVMSVSTTGSFAAAASGSLLAGRPAAAASQTIEQTQFEVPAPQNAAEEPTPPPGRTVVVEPHDTFWDLAERFLGDGLRWREIRDLNVGQVMADGHMISTGSDLLRPGWVLTLPSPSEEPSPSPTGDAEPEAIPEVTVQPGDSIWRIVESHLHSKLGRQPSVPEVSTYCDVVVEVNRDRLADPDDPDRIYSGQILLLPAPATEAAPSGPGAVPPPASPAPDPGPAPGPPPSPELPPSVSTSIATSTTNPPTPPSTGAPDRRNADVDTSTRSRDDEDDELNTSVLALATAASAALALGVTAAIRRRRRQRNHLVPTIAPVPSVEERFHQELVVAGDEDAVDALAWSLHDLARGLADAGHSCRPLVVQNGHNHTEALLDQPTLPAIAGWDADAGGAVWTFDSVAHLAPDPQRWSTPAPLLVSIGRPATSGQTYLDLEAAGVTSLVGDRMSRVDVARTVATEIAHSPLAETSQLLLVGDLGLPALVDQLDRVVVVESWDAAIDELTEWADQSRLALDQSGFPNPFVARGDDPSDDSLVPLLVVALEPPPDPAALEFLRIAPSAAAAIVVTDDCLPGSMVVECWPDAIRVPELGLACAPVALDEEEFAAIIDLLTTASDTSGDQLTLSLDGTSEVPAKPRTTGSTYVDPTYEVLVRFLGDITVEGDLRRALTPKETAAVAFIALNGSVTVDRVEDALWAAPTSDTRRKRLINLMTDCRSALTSERFPKAQNAHYAFRSSVVTDLSLFDLRVATSLAEPRHSVAGDILLGALELCRGPVFHYAKAERDSYSWVEAGNLASHWELKIAKVAQDFAELCLGRSDVERAVVASEAGLRVMPTHVGCTEALMRAHASNGDRVAFQHVYEAHRAALELIHLDEVAESTADLYERLQAS